MSLSECCLVHELFGGGQANKATARQASKVQIRRVTSEEWRDIFFSSVSYIYILMFLSWPSPWS